MMRHVGLAMTPLAVLLAAACGSPAAPIEPMAPATQLKVAPNAGAAAERDCQGAASIVEDARKLVKEGRYLRAAVRLDEAEAMCGERAPDVVALHAQALAEVGRCADVRRLGSSAGGAGALKEAEGLCAERTRGASDPAAQAKSRSLSREGQGALRRGDRALAERLAAEALAAAATDEALLLDGRVRSQKGDEQGARRAFDRAFVALERGGPASVLVVPHADAMASREDGSLVASGGGRLLIFRSDAPDRVTAIAWPDAKQRTGYVNTEIIIAAGNGRFAVAGKRGVGWLDIEGARVVDTLAETDPTLRMLPGGRRVLVFEGGNPERAAVTKLVDLTDPARLKVIKSHNGGGIDVAEDGSAFLVKGGAGVEVVDAATGQVLETFQGAASAAISSTGKLVALCSITKPASGAEPAEARLTLHDREKKRARWTKTGACSPMTPMAFDPLDRVLYTPQTLSVANGAEVPDKADAPGAKAPKAGPAPWIAAAFAESALGCTRALSGDGGLFSAGCYGSQDVYEARTGKRVFKSPTPVKLPPRGWIVATETALCDVRTGACTSLAKQCNKGSVIFSPDAPRALCTSADGVREITWDESLNLKTNRVFPGSKGWVPAFAGADTGSKRAGALKLTATAAELVFLDFEKGVAAPAGQPPGLLVSPDGGFTVTATAAEPSIYDYVAGKRGALREHAGAIAATLVSADGRLLGLKDAQQTWRFWGMPEGALRARFDALDRPKAKPNEPMPLSGTMGLVAQILTTGYIAGSLGARNPWQLNLDQGFWLAPISDPSRLLEARWSENGGYLIERRLGSNAAGKARVALLGAGSALVACAFGDVIAPLDVCREAFVFNELAERVMSSIPPR